MAQRLAVFIGLMLALQPLHSVQVLEMGDAVGQYSLDPATDLDRVRQRFGLPALAVGLVDSKGLRFSRVRGLRAWGHTAPVRATDPFHLGSCGKSMTSTLIELLVQEGLLAWEDTLGELFADLPGMHAKWSKVTLDQIARHQGAMPADLIKFHGGELVKAMTKPGLSPSQARWAFVKALLSYAPSGRPGKKFAYSNSGYLVLGTVAELAAKKPFETLMQERLFKPLDMGDCGFGPMGRHGESKPSAPWGHQWTYFKIQAFDPGPDAGAPAAMAPAGRMHCSLESWGKFLAIHLNAAKGAPVDLLPLESLRALQTPPKGEVYTRGAWIYSTRDWTDGAALTHQGSNGWHRSLVWIVPSKGLAYVALTNVAGDRAEKALEEALQILLFYGSKLDNR